MAKSACRKNKVLFLSLCISTSFCQIRHVEVSKSKLKDKHSDSMNILTIEQGYSLILRQIGVLFLRSGIRVWYEISHFAYF